MHALISFITVIHVVLCVLIVLAVLVQQGKGAEISASFGGSSQTVFGSSGGANFFSIFTGVCAALFMFSSVFLATQGGSRAMSHSVMDQAIPAPATAPTSPATAPGATTTQPGTNAGAPTGATGATGSAAATGTAAATAGAAVGATTDKEVQVGQPKPDTQAHAPDQATKNAISPGAANLPTHGAANPTAPQGH